LFPIIRVRITSSRAIRACAPDLLLIDLLLDEVLEGKSKQIVSATRRPSVRADPQGMQPG
jgi:hypothetical protein